MANQAAARLAGDDYQHLVGWLYLLELLIPARRVRQVTVEDPDAGFVDDVTVVYEPGSPEPDRFVQVKYHVDQRGLYSTDAFLAAKAGGRSLLRKFYDSWGALRSRTGREVELRLVTNWTWDPDDPVRRCIRGEDNALSERFCTAPAGTAVGKARRRWREHLSVAEDEFRAFAETIRLRLGFDCAEELEERVSERMLHLGLRHDRAALLTGAGIVRTLIKEGRRNLARSDIEALLAEHELHLPPSAEPATTVYLWTVKEQHAEIPPDYLIDWRQHFEGDERKRGHAVLDPAVWNGTMLPELLALEHELNTRSLARLIRARGRARLSPWFAFGHTFSEVAGYTIEVEQQGKLWRTDAAPSDLAVVEHGRERIEGGDPSAVAAGISVTGLLEADVGADLRATHTAGAVLYLRPDRELGRDCFVSAADVAAFARGAKERLRAFVKEHGARRLLLYYFGPLSGACFLGHQLNAVAREVKVMEDQQPGYAPAFVLT
jgi:hypothetical protein